MRKTILLAVTGVTVISGLLTGITGCNTKVELSIAEIREYTDDITEDMLKAANTGDYIEYCKHLDDTMKAAVSEYSFSATNTMIKARIGDFISKKFWKAEIEGENIIVYYKARYTLEPEDVEIKVVFRRAGYEWYVGGIYHSSPLLDEE